MIQPLRTIHRRMFLVLALVLPAIFIAGLKARHTWPVMAAPQIQNADSSASFETNGNWRLLPVRLRIFSAEPGRTPTRVQLEPQKDLAEPEVLVYWSGSEPQNSSLPDGARLLGKLDPAVSYALPEHPDKGGFLILFSGARNALLDWTIIGGHP